MENTLNVPVTFNENIVRNQLWKYFYYSWKKKLPTIFRNLCYTLLALFVFDSLIGNKSRYDFLRFAFIFSGVICIFYVIYFFYQKANYSIKLDKHIDELKGYHATTELYFDEDSILIKSEQFDVRSIWKKVTYEVSNKIIFIHIELGSVFTYLVSKEETNQYEEILDFLKSKARPKGK